MECSYRQMECSYRQMESCKSRYRKCVQCCIAFGWVLVQYCCMHFVYTSTLIIHYGRYFFYDQEQMDPIPDHGTACMIIRRIKLIFAFVLQLLHVKYVVLTSDPVIRIIIIKVKITGVRTLYCITRSPQDELLVLHGDYTGLAINSCNNGLVHCQCQYLSSLHIIIILTIMTCSQSIVSSYMLVVTTS